MHLKIAMGHCFFSYASVDAALIWEGQNPLAEWETEKKSVFPGSPVKVQGLSVP